MLEKFQARYLYLRSKLLKLVQDDKILALILNKMHFEPIHKTIFTMIFCLGQKASLNSKKVL